MEKEAGTLYIVATPIGNLEDMTLRAIRILKEVDLIACEDTRVTKNLLTHFEIKTPTTSYFQHSKLSKIEFIIGQLSEGKNIALVTDAGTPGISDPGQALIQKIREFSITNFQSPIKVVPVPGASALTAAASVCGMIEKEFYFAGFLPKKKGRQTKFKEISLLKIPIVIYESAMRLEKTLGDFKSYFGENTEIFIARESTKMFEEYWGGKIDEVIADLLNHKMKGELVLIVRKQIGKSASQLVS